MKKLSKIFIILNLFILSACSNGSNVKQYFEKEAPDEFMVISNPPLTIPPNYDLIPPQSEVSEEKTVGMDFTKNEDDISKFGRAEQNMLGKMQEYETTKNIRNLLQKQENIKKGWFEGSDKNDNLDATREHKNLKKQN